MKALIIIASIYLLGLILLFINRFRYYNRVIKKEYKSSAPLYALNDAYKWPVTFAFIFAVLFSVLFDGIKNRKQRKEVLRNFKDNSKL